MVGWARSAYTWLLLRPVSRGFWSAALLFLVAATVANAASGDWLSVVVGSLVAAVISRRLWTLRGADEDRLPTGQERAAKR